MVGQILLIQEDHWLARRCRPAANHGQPSSYDSGGYKTLETVNIHVCLSLTSRVSATNVQSQGVASC